MPEQVLNESPQIPGSEDEGAVDRLDIGGLTLDLRREELRDAAGRLIELRNRSLSVLRYLATNAGRLVSKDELLGANWPGVTVTEDSLTQCISDIRRVSATLAATCSFSEASARLYDRRSEASLTTAGERFKRADGGRPALREQHPGRPAGRARGRHDAAYHPALGRFAELRVLARGATIAYKGRVPNATELRRDLGATTRSTAFCGATETQSRVDI